MNLMGEVLGSIKYYEGFLTRQTNATTGLAFHPRSLSLAINTGQTVALYQSEANQHQLHKYT
jgi:regulator-associated protein of mTOR